MSAARIAPRYAKSLLDLAIEQGKVDSVLSNVETFVKACENRDLTLLLKSPIINEGKKQQVVQALFGSDFDAVTLGFLRLIIAKRREEFLPEIAAEFVTQYKAMNNITSATLTTATALSEAAVADIKARLLKEGVLSGEVELVTNVNPDLIGGFVLEFADKRYDASVAHKLDKLRKEFRGNSYQKAM